MADQDWVDVDINESDWVDVPNEKPSLLNRAAQFITKDYPRAMSRASTDIASGFGRGVASLMPSSKALATAVMPVRPNEISALLAPLLSKIKSPVENLPAPEGIRGQLLQGAGSLAPTLIPMQKGLGLIEGPAQKLIEKIPQSKLRGLLSTIARPAVGFGGYEAGKGLLTEEAPTPVRSAIEGMKTGALFGAAGRVGEKLLPGAAGRALGGGAGMAITAPEGERASGFITGATLGAGAETPRDIKAYQIVSERAPKIIRPTVSGKQTGRDIERYNKSVSDAFIDIVDNKADLGLTDAFGNPVSRTPRNVDETLDGIRNLKQKKYDAYNSMQKNAGEAGAIVSTEPLVQELAKFATDPAISKFDPSGALQGYAKQMAEVYAKGIDTGEAQRILELINAKTKGKTFASPNDQSKLAIDQLVANHLRKGLDSVITETEGAGYSKLRKDYSNLLKLEKDLTKRNIVFKRRSQSGFFDLSDVYTAKEMVQGILTGNAQQTLAGAAGFGTKMLLKMRNNPDVQIRDLFKDLERIGKKPVIPESTALEGELIEPGQVEFLPPKQRQIEGRQNPLLTDQRTPLPLSRRLQNMSGRRTIEQGTESTGLGQINLPQDIKDSYRYIQGMSNEKAINLPTYEELIKWKQIKLNEGVPEQEVNEIIRQNLMDKARGARGSLPDSVGAAAGEFVNKKPL